MPSKTITATGSNGHHIFDLYVNETATSTANNTSTVAFTFSMRASGYDWYWSPPTQPVTWIVTINGTAYTGAIYTYAANTALTIKTGSQTVTHNANGTKTIDVSFSVSSLGYAYLPGSASANGTLALTSIARYPTVTQSLSARTETTLTVQWTSDSIIDVISWSTNNGASWTTIDVTDGKSGRYTITGLAAGTTYQVKTRVRSKASGLTTDSSVGAFATYEYPYATSMPDIQIGQGVRIGFANPLGRSVTVDFLDSSGAVAASGSGSGVAVYLVPAAATLYASIPNSKSATYSVRITYGTHVTTRSGGIYTANANVALPTLTALTYHDTFSRTTAITNDNQVVIQNKSRVQFDATGLSGFEGSTILSASLSVGSTTVAMTISETSATVSSVNIDASSDVEATVTITDSRGFTATASVTLTVLPYYEPRINGTVARKNNFYSETDITITADIASLGGKNFSSYLAFQYAKSGEEYGEWTALTAGETTTVSLDNQFAWTVRIRLRDRLSTVYATYTVLVGLPIFYVDRLLRSIGINCFPKEAASIEVNGIDLCPHVLTGRLSTNISSFVAGTYTQIELDTSTSFGTKLTMEQDGSVLIGNNVSYVLISAKCIINASNSPGARALRIFKNSMSDANIISSAVQTTDAAGYVDLTISQTLISVSPGDKILLAFSAQSGDVITGAVSNGTYISLEVVG